MNTEKQFVGRVQQVPTKFGLLTKISISQDDFDKHKSNGWLNCILKTSKEGKTYLQVDDWKPDPSKRKSETKHDHSTDNHVMTNDLPF